MTQGELYIQSPPIQAPEVILVGDLQINKVQSIYNISCQNCHLTNCIDPKDRGRSILVLRQPPYIVIPTTIEGPWYDDPGTQAFEEIKNGLSREQRVVRLIIAGLAAIISLVATAITAAVSLTNSIKTADYVEQLAKYHFNFSHPGKYRYKNGIKT